MLVQIIWLITITTSLVSDSLSFSNTVSLKSNVHHLCCFFISRIKLPPIVKEDKKEDGLELDQKQTQDIWREEIRL